MKSNIKTVIGSSILVLGLTPIAIYGHEFKLVASGIAFCVFTDWRLRVTTAPKYLTVVYATLPILVLYLPVFVFTKEPPLTSLPSTVFHFVGVLFGLFIFFSIEMYKKVILYLALFSFCLFMFFSGYALWLHKVSYNTYTGKVLKPAPLFQMEDEYGKLFTNESFKGKTLVIDFWTTSCAICFKKFPKLEELHAKIKGRTDIIAFAVNVPLKGDSKTEAISMIRERQYSFPILFAESEPINMQFEFNAYPTVFIIRNEQIIYYGDIDNVESLLGI